MRTCNVNGCDRPYRARGLCVGHYERFRHGKDIFSPLRPKDPTRPCEVDGCDGVYVAKGLCRLHYGRRWREQATA